MSFMVTTAKRYLTAASSAATASGLGSDASDAVTQPRIHVEDDRLPQAPA
jgi:hypothetical protein